MNFIKKYWWVIILLILFPFGVNALYLLEAPFECFQEPQPWTVFWATYIAGIASFMMLFFTYKSLRLTVKELGPLVDFRIEYVGNNTFNLTVFNMGKSIAKNIEITIDVKEFEDEKLKKDLSDCTMGPYNLLPNEKITVTFIKSVYYVHEGTELSFVFGKVMKCDVSKKLLNSMNKSMDILCKYDEGEDISRKIKLEDILSAKYESVYENV